MSSRSGRGTPRQTVRIPEPAWITFGELAEAAGTDRSAVIRQFVDWYTRQPDAKLPRRPPQP